MAVGRKPERAKPTEIVAPLQYYDNHTMHQILQTIL